MNCKVMLRSFRICKLPLVESGERCWICMSSAPGRPPEQGPLPVDSIVNLYNELKLANPPEIGSALTSSHHVAGDFAANKPSK
jgi:hypothetical protein